jgi:hypothetical protein
MHLKMARLKLTSSPANKKSNDGGNANGHLALFVP